MLSQFVRLPTGRVEFTGILWCVFLPLSLCFRFSGNPVLFVRERRWYRHLIVFYGNYCLWCFVFPLVPVVLVQWNVFYTKEDV